MNTSGKSPQSIQQKAKMMTFNKNFTRLKERKDDREIYRLLDNMIDVLETYSEGSDYAINSLIKRMKNIQQHLGINPKTNRIHPDSQERLDDVIAEIELYLTDYFT